MPLEPIDDRPEPEVEQRPTRFGRTPRRPPRRATERLTGVGAPPEPPADWLDDVPPERDSGSPGDGL